MSSENEEIIRNAYQVAEKKDLEGFVNCFTLDGTFTDQSIGVTYQGQEIAITVDQADRGEVQPLNEETTARVKARGRSRLNAKNGSEHK